MIDSDLIAKILTPAVEEISYSDFENDFQLLFHWLEPYYPGQFQEPSPRIKSAIRTCLKTGNQQQKFVNMYIKFIQKQFQVQSFEGASFLHIIKTLDSINVYFSQYLKYLRLSSYATQIFNRHLNALYYSKVVNPKFLHITKQYFEFALFNNNYTEELLYCISVLNNCGLGELANTHIIMLSMEKIQEHVKTTCAGIWDQPCSKDLKTWINSYLYPFFSMVTKDNKYLTDLNMIAQNELVSLRILEIFDIVKTRKFVALNELHECLVQPSETQKDQREKLVQSFIENCNLLLLHSGVDTIDVVKMYASTIKSFLIIDPRGVLLDKVIRPIRKYLKSRQDVVQKIVNGILYDNHDGTNKLSELAEELKKAPEKPTMDEPEMNWVPDPIDALPDFKKGKVGDIIESLISLFDSKSVFINEFTDHFGKKLLQLGDYDTSEVANSLELLKTRFGGTKFTTLEIMIKDIIDSKKINELIFQDSIQQNTITHCKILSHLYWSMLPDPDDEGNFKLPSSIESQLNSFQKSFCEKLQGRHLKFIPQLGNVKLELDFNGTRLFFEVTPLEATVISLFNDEDENGLNNSISMEFLKNKLETTNYQIRKAVDMWIKKGVLEELQPDHFTISKTTPPQSTNSGKSFSSVLSHRFAQLEEIWPFLKGILTNLGPLTSQRLQSFLSTTIPNDQQQKYFNSSISFQEYLDWCVSEEKLVYENDLYRLA